MMAVMTMSKATVTPRGTITVLISALPTGDIVQARRFTGSQVHRFIGERRRCEPVDLCTFAPLWHACGYALIRYGQLTLADHRDPGDPVAGRIRHARRRRVDSPAAGDRGDRADHPADHRPPRALN